MVRHLGTEAGPTQHDFLFTGAIVSLKSDGWTNALFSKVALEPGA